MDDFSARILYRLQPEHFPPESEEWLHTCTIITGEPSELVREIHTRMPVILPESITRLR